MAPPSELNQDILPIQLPMQSIHMSRRRTSRIMTRSETAAAGSAHKHIQLDIASPTVSTFEEQPHHQLSMLARLSRMITRAGKEERLHYHPNGGPHQHHHHQHHHHRRHSHSHSHGSTTSPSLKKQLFSKATVVTLEKKYATVHWAGEFNKILLMMTCLCSLVFPPFSPFFFALFYEIDCPCVSHDRSLASLIEWKKGGGGKKNEGGNSVGFFFPVLRTFLFRMYSRVSPTLSPCPLVTFQSPLQLTFLFRVFSCVVLQLAEFYCTITSPCFALPLFLYLDPSFRWSAPEIHSTHFTIALSVLTALTSTLYHATLYKIFSSLDACFATIMFYLNTIHLLRSLPSPYASMVPALIGSVVHWEWTPYVIAVGMTTLFVISWQRTAMLSLMLMVMMIPATIWGFIVHEQWLGLGFGLVGLSMFAADRFKFFCGHSWWHLAGGLSLWYGIASGALAK